MRTSSPATGATVSTESSAAVPARPSAPAAVQVETLGHPGDTVLLADGEVLAEAAVAEVRLHHDAEDLVSGREQRCALAERLDHAGEVLAEHDRVAVLHHALEHAGGHRPVEAVHRRRLHLDQDLAVAWRGAGMSTTAGLAPASGIATARMVSSSDSTPPRLRLKMIE